MKKINYSLPEFAFLDGQCHIGNILQNRTVLIHIRTASIIEVICLDEIKNMQLNCKQYFFKYKNIFGLTENYLFALHYTFAGEGEIDTIFKKTEKWYCDYMTWEDKNIIDDEFSKHN